jgi:thiamine-phosphate pyrophosphorylase
MTEAHAEHLRSLLAVAARLAARAATPVPALLPPLLYLSDSARSADPVRIAQQLPSGCGVVLRHYDRADRTELARALAEVCRVRALTLLVAADPALAAEVGADGVHWPEGLLVQQTRRVPGLVTASAHGIDGLQAALAHGCDAAIVSPVFATASHPDAVPLGVAGLRTLLRAVPVPVFALGGVTAQNAPLLLGSGAAGIAAVSAFEP